METMNENETPINENDASSPGPGEIAAISTVEQFAKSAIADQIIQDDEWKKQRRLKLFNDRTFFANKLVEKKENGAFEYSKLIEHIKFLEEVIKDFKTIHQAYELVKINHVNNASLEERARIAAEDKKYTPKFKEREANEVTKQSEYEKKLGKLIKLGISKAAAEKILGTN